MTAPWGWKVGFVREGPGRDVVQRGPSSGRPSSKGGPLENGRTIHQLRISASEILFAKPSKGMAGIRDLVWNKFRRSLLVTEIPLI